MQHADGSRLPRAHIIAVLPAMGAKLAQRRVAGRSASPRHVGVSSAGLSVPVPYWHKVGQKRLPGLSQQRKRTSVSVAQ